MAHRGLSVADGRCSQPIRDARERRSGPGERDNTVPWSIANASYHEQQDNPGITEIVKIAGRGHSLTIDAGWREVADTALAFVKQHVPATTG